jgi:hypothetical protein
MHNLYPLFELNVNNREVAKPYFKVSRIENTSKKLFVGKFKPAMNNYDFFS